MNEKAKSAATSQMRQSWESFEWLIKDKLIELDNMTRAMMREMQYCGVTLSLMNEYIPKQFARLWEEVAAEQSEKYDRKERSA